MRTGTLLKDTVYLIVKTYEGDGTKSRFAHTAPAGTRVEWNPERFEKDGHTGTNAGIEHAYGGRFLFWIDLVHPDGGHYGNVGAEAGVDFTWDANKEAVR